VHQTVRIFHVGRHSVAWSGEIPKGRKVLVRVISHVEKYDCTNYLCKLVVRFGKEKGIGLTDRTGEARVQATSRQSSRSWMVSLQQDSI
jgi:hypothetical protein